MRIGIESAPPDLDHVTRAARRAEIELIALSSGGEAPDRQGQLEQELAGLRAQAAEMTARWRAEQGAIAAIQQIKKDLAAKRAEAARFERAGDLVRAAAIGYGQVESGDQLRFS